MFPLSLIANPSNPPLFTRVTFTSAGSIGLALSSSLASTLPGIPPFLPLIGVALKSSSVSAILEAPTKIVALLVSQLPGFRFSQIEYVIT